MNPAEWSGPVLSYLAVALAVATWLARGWTYTAPWYAIVRRRNRQKLLVALLMLAALACAVRAVVIW